MNLVGTMRPARIRGLFVVALTAAVVVSAATVAGSVSAASLSSADAQLARNNVEGAIADYQAVLATDPTNVEALTNLAVWQQAVGNTAGAQAAVNQLPADRAGRVVALMQNVAKAQSFPLTDQVPGALAAGTGIVILGYGLENNGAMRPLLVERLTKGLAVARAYPSFPIIVTGGNPKAGKTEAGQMRDWLVANGVSPSRITVEDRAVSTQSNALNSVRLYPQAGITSGIVLVTSSDHTRRSVADFLVAGSTEQAVVASDAAAQSGPMSTGAIVLMYRDAMGTAGL
ncbi:ElyC/SanA/YdcF family protein [Tsukamurella soli]